MAAFFHAFFNDQRVQIVLLLVALDLLLGVLVALVGVKQPDGSRKSDFRLSFVADFARNDILGKVAPFAALYAGYLYAKNVDIVIPGFDMEVAMNAAWAVVLAALVGSLLGSIKQLGLSALPEEVAGPDPATPQVPPNA